MLKGYAQNGIFSNGFSFFCRMMEDGVQPVVYNFTYLLKGIGEMGDFGLGRQVHGLTIVSGHDGDVYAMTCVVNMYAKCGLVDEAYKVFVRLSERDLISWNTIVAGYVKNGFGGKAVELVGRMVRDGLRPDQVTIVSVLPGVGHVGDLRVGKVMHGYVLRSGYEGYGNVATALVDMYLKCGSLSTGRVLFDKMSGRNVVSWNIMIDGYAQSGDYAEAFMLFEKMLDKGFKPTGVTLMAALHACADSGDLARGQFVHRLVDELGLHTDVSVINSLISMYCKCKRVDIAAEIFKNLKDKTRVSWNAMILGYAQNGQAINALNHFRLMKVKNIEADSFTMVSIISAVAELSILRQAKWIHGFVEEGKRFFSSMKEKYDIEPTMDHYGAMVDLLGRSGRLTEAWDFILNMPVKPQTNVFGAMLGACKIHKNVELGEMAAKRLFELNPSDGGYYVLLANIYASASMWDKVAEIRSKMEERGIRKTPGYSSVDLENGVHTFYSGSSWHYRSKEIYGFLEILIDKIKAAGYVPDNDSIHDAEDDLQEQLAYCARTHSEKLAIAFGLLNTSPGTAIHIRKNLRVCGDCHNATKYISLVEKREIIVRDLHRFHHFKNGICSCGDYW
nr:pentatricopeptide repeat-containing protein At1g11290, chloroplastic [Tanacetum cinerariifolium]